LEGGNKYEQYYFSFFQKHFFLFISVDSLGLQILQETTKADMKISLNKELSTSSEQALHLHAAPSMGL